MDEYQTVDDDETRVPEFIFFLFVPLRLARLVGFIIRLSCQVVWS